MMTLDRLNELLGNFCQQRVAVLGDFFLDKYLEIDPALSEPSLETGRVAHQVVEVRSAPGAAGTVVNNLAALGVAELFALGVIGDDGSGYELSQGLHRLGCHTSGLVKRSDIYTPTYLKPRDMGVPGLAGEHLRYDTKNRKPLPTEITTALISHLEKLLSRIDALIVMDQVEIADCGVVSSAMRSVLAELASGHPKVIFWADSRRFIRQYRNLIIKPNQFEAVGRANPLPGDQVNQHDLRAVIPALRDEIGAPVFVTCGSKGMLVSDPEPTLIPGVRVTGPIDPTGAGDSATAGAVLTLASGGTCAEAALVGNLVAACTIQQLGTTGTATTAQVLEQFAVWEEQHARPGHRPAE